VIADGVRAQFPGANACLETASLGLLPTAAIEAIRAVPSEWRAGTAMATGSPRRSAAEPAAHGHAQAEGVQSLAGQPPSLLRS